MGALLDLDFVGRQDRLVGKQSWRVEHWPCRCYNPVFIGGDPKWQKSK